MKKLIVLFSVLALTFVFSCSSDDDSPSQDPFIGSWKAYKFYEDGVEVTLDICDYEAIIVVSSNGTFTTTAYDDFGNGCEIDYEISGTWENLGNDLYSTTNDGDTFVQELIFEDNIMYYEEVDGGVTYRDEFIRQ